MVCNDQSYTKTKLQICTSWGIVSYHDPYIPEMKTNEGNEFKSVELSAETLADADVVVLTTNHSVFDVEFIQEHAQMVVDMRNMIKVAGEKVYKL